MRYHSQLLPLLPLLLLSLLASSGAVGDDKSDLGPQIPAPIKGEQCVETTEVMRRNHMEYLLRHRDKTVREGIRAKQYSLKECLNCHVPAADPEIPARMEEHFCASCHQYTGVRIDCFECHATQPDRTIPFHPLATPDRPMGRDTHPSSAELLKTLATEEGAAGRHK